MSFSRYTFSSRRKDFNGENYISVSNASHKIFKAVERGVIDYDTMILERGQRLDTIAGYYYEDSSYWWVIAAASGIGYALQVPPGTGIRIPRSLGEVFGALA